MDRKKALEYLNIGKDNIKVDLKNGKTLTFARQQEKDIEEIEKTSSEELILEWKGLVGINFIYGQVSINELQRIDLIEMEFKDREDINPDELKQWFKTEKAKQEKEEEK